MDKKGKRFHRVLLKLSGEAIAKKNEKGETEEIFDVETIEKIADVIKRMHDDNLEIGIVIGAGNEARSQLLKYSQLILTERL